MRRRRRAWAYCYWHWCWLRSHQRRREAAWHLRPAWSAGGLVTGTPATSPAPTTARCRAARLLPPSAWSPRPSVSTARIATSRFPTPRPSSRRMSRLRPGSTSVVWIQHSREPRPRGTSTSSSSRTREPTILRVTRWRNSESRVGTRSCLPSALPPGRRWRSCRRRWSAPQCGTTLRPFVGPISCSSMSTASWRARPTWASCRITAPCRSILGPRVRPTGMAN